MNSAINTLPNRPPGCATNIFDLLALVQHLKKSMFGPVPAQVLLHCKILTLTLKLRPSAATQQVAPSSTLQMEPLHLFPFLWITMQQHAANTNNLRPKWGDIDLSVVATAPPPLTLVLQRGEAAGSSQVVDVLVSLGGQLAGRPGRAGPAALRHRQ